VTTVSVTLEGTMYRVKQRPGYVLIYKRTRRPSGLGRDHVIWDSRKAAGPGEAPKLDSVVARVLAKASRHATLILSKGTGDG
jgi:hypothetical protein